MALSVEEVRAALADGDDAIRHHAVSRLDLSEAGAIAVLVMAMADDHWRVRREAVDRVTRDGSGGSEWSAILVPLLGEPDNVGLRNAAAEAVVGLGVAATPAVEAALVGKPEHRKVLCDVLGRIGAGSSALALLPFLDDEDKNVQIAAAEALGRLETETESLSTVVAALDARIGKVLLMPSDPSTDLLATALLEAMAKRRAPLSAALLETMLAHTVVGVGALKALGAGALPGSTSERAVVRALVVPELENKSRARREAAILALAQVLPTRDEPDIILSISARSATTEALLEGTVEVQRAAAGVLGATGSPEIARPLLVASSDPSLTDAIDQALARVAERDLAGLLAVAGAMMPSARAAAYRVLADALPRVSSAEATPLFQVLAGDVDAEDTDVAVAALGALGALGAESGAKVIVETLQRTYDQRDDLESAWERIEAGQLALAALAARTHDAVVAEVRAHADAPPFIGLLGRLGGRDDVAPLLKRLREADVEIRRSAAEALADLLLRPEVELDASQTRKISDAAREALVDEAPVVRAAGVRALASAERRAHVGATAIEGLLGAAHDEDVRVRGAAARALVDLATHMSGADAESLHAGLRALADGTDALTAVPALEALLAARSTADDARLIDALTGADEERRKIALHALAARPQLVTRGDLLRLTERALHDERWDLRRAAIAALAAVGDAGRPALVNRRTLEKDPLVRADLDRALGRVVPGAGKRG